MAHFEKLTHSTAYKGRRQPGPKEAASAYVEVRVKALGLKV